MRIIALACAAGALALTSGCASITQGTSQTLVFKFDPQEARCVATRDGDGELGSVSYTQDSLTVGKDKDDIILACKADGYLNKTMRLKSSTQAAGVVGGMFLDFGITDMLTGAMWAYPSDVNVALEKLPTQPGAAPAAVQAAPAPASAAPVPVAVAN